MNRLPLAALVLLTCCRSPVGPAGMESYVPPGAIAVAGVDLAYLRSSPLYPKLQGMLPSDARSMLLAYRGKDLLVIADGKLTGPAGMVQAAEAQHRTGKSGAPDLLAHVPPGKHIWMVVRGGATLPLTGNAANLNRLLRDMDFAAVTVTLDPSADVEITARSRTPEAALHFEDTLRATLTLAAAGKNRQPELAALLRSVKIHRENREVHAGIALPSDAAQAAIGVLTENKSDMRR